MRANGSCRAQDTVRSSSYGMATRRQSTLRVFPKGGNGIRIAGLYAYTPTVYRSPLQYKGGRSAAHPAISWRFAKGGIRCAPPTLQIAVRRPLQLSDPTFPTARIFSPANVQFH